MKIQTKSGFVCDVNEKIVADWDFLDVLCDSESDDQTTRVRASRDAVKMLLGKEGAAALAEHVKDKNGIKNSLWPSWYFPHWTGIEYLRWTGWPPHTGAGLPCPPESPR